MTGLYTVNYAILGGQSNRYLQYEAKNSLGVTVNKPADTVYKIFQRAFGKDMSSGMTAFLLTMIIVIVTCAVLVTFFRTRMVWRLLQLVIMRKWFVHLRLMQMYPESVGL